MKILVVKLTSMGDILHLMPALTELANARSDVSIDWLVEDGFKEIPSWHSLVNKVIPVATRRWRGLKFEYLKEIIALRKEIRSSEYDLIIDAQGLIKSALIAKNAKLKKGGKLVGFCGKSIKESPAAWLYDTKISVGRSLHAVERLRSLFAKAFGYSLQSNLPSYEISDVLTPKATEKNFDKFVIFLHGTTWDTKHLPESLWLKLVQQSHSAGYSVKLAWGNNIERDRANRIANNNGLVTVLDKSSLAELANIMASASGIIAVDTGLGHLAAGLNIPCVSIYGSTNSALTGTAGQYQTHIQTDYVCSPCMNKQCSQITDQTSDLPCYQTLSANHVWQQLETQILASR